MLLLAQHSSSLWLQWYESILDDHQDIEENPENALRDKEVYFIVDDLLMDTTASLRIMVLKEKQITYDPKILWRRGFYY